MIVTRQPRRVLGRWTTAALLVLGATLPAFAQPVVILDNIIDGSDPVGGYPIAGGAQGPSQNLAISFTTDASAYLLTSVTVPIAPGGPPPTLPIQLQIRTDNGGLPSDTVLDSLLTSDFGQFPDFQVNWSPNNVALSPNTTYWLAVLAGSPDTSRIWQFNNIGQTGGIAANQGIGWFNAPPGTTPGARIIGVRVSAAAPEPGTLSLFVLGVLSVSRLRRRRSARQE